MTPRQILYNLPAFRGAKKFVVQDQGVNDIIGEILNAHKVYASHYDKIAPKFWKGSTKKTAAYLWQWCKDHLPYKIEPDKHQSTKSPSAIIAQAMAGSGYNDCKHYSQFIGGILDALKRQGKPVNWVYRFANYRDYGNTPHHVFIVAKDQKNEIWIDPVLNSFDYKKPYSNAIDKKINPMALYQISGTNCNCRKTPKIKNIDRVRFAGVDDPFGQLAVIGRKDSPKNIAKYKAKMARAAQPKNVAKYKAKMARAAQPKNVAKYVAKQKRLAEGLCKGGLVQKIALSPARNAFLALVKLNVKSVGTKLVTTYNDPEKRRKLYQKWCKLGGNASALKSAILSVAKKKNIAVVGVALPAILAAAAAILQALKEFLPQQTNAEIQSEIAQVTPAEVVSAKQYFQNGDEQAQERQIARPQNMPVSQMNEQAQDFEPDAMQQDYESAKKENKPQNNTLLYLGIAAAAGLILSQRNN